jgi:hypothetical protein
MSDAEPAGADPADPLNLDGPAALFASLVVQQSNMALMFLGRVAHPETGQTFTDLEAARLFIDQLEMLEIKTKGNLSAEESALLKQSLMNLRLAFVQAVESAPPKDQAQPAPPAKPAPPPADSPAAPSQPSAGEEHRPKFSKKY